MILEIDAIDNGVDQADGLKYSLRSNLSARVGKYNSPWNAPADAQYSQHAQFKRAMKMTEQAFVHELYGKVMIIMPAQALVQQAWDNKDAFHKSGQFLWFEKSCPWKEHLYRLERDLQMEELIKFAFYKDGRGMYRI